MEAIIAALDDQQAELDDLLGGLEDADWVKPSRCPGWSVADVMLHLAQTTELAAAAGDSSFAQRLGRFMPAGARTVDEGAERAVVAERGAGTTQLLQRWRDAAAAQRRLFAESEPGRRLPTIRLRLFAARAWNSVWSPHGGSIRLRPT